MPRISKASGIPQTKITLTCSIEQRRRIRMLAAQEDKSMNEFLLSLVEEKEKRCPLCETYELAELTVKTMKEADRGENIEEYESVEDFWQSIGRDIDADTKKHKAV